MSIPVIIAARRTVLDRAHGAFRDDTAADLASVVWRALREDVPGLIPDDVVLGLARGPGGNPARVSALAAGWPVDVPAVTVDRQCGAGLDAVCLAAAEIASASSRVIAAGGAESASTAAPGRSTFAPDEFGDPDMGPAADDLAQRRGITRERQDRYAARSHARAVAARDAGAFDDEVIAWRGLARDPRPRAVSADLLTRAPTAFGDTGTVTAANCSPISDGAAGTLIVTEQMRAELGLPGLAITAWARAGVDPRWPGVGPTPAVRAVLDRAGASVAQLDRIEMTEAFAAQTLAVLDDLGIDQDDDRVCADGGAIALGHPWGASGAVLVVRLFTAMVRQDSGRFGLATCAIGGGQGVALLVERVGP